MPEATLLTFPDFNIYSTPLLVLVSQGLVFSLLLFQKYFKRQSISYLILGVVLLITCYHRTTYTIGFMDWYDTFRHTKINYYLIDLELVLVPLIFFYVKSITSSDFSFKARHLWHFLPGFLYILIKVFMLIYDSNQPGFADSQNGYLVVHFQWKYLDPFHTVITYLQTVIYLVLTLQLYFNYRKNILQYFSNTYQLELNWIRNFLLIYTLLFLYGLIQTLVNLTVAELNWIQKWWQHFFTALAIIYVGVKGYFTDTDRLKGLGFSASRIYDKSESIAPKSSLAKMDDEVERKATLISDYFETHRPYLDPELNLISLSNDLKLSRSEVSEAINDGLGKNFNDFVNSYRVKAVQQMLKQGKHEQLSLLGIALECGFNSKATFNRVFKKITQQSPTEYLTSIHQAS